MNLTSRLISRTTVAAKMGTRSFVSHRTSLVLTPQEVNNLKHAQSSVALLDASWFMPNSPRNPKTEFQSQRIPGAQLLDLDEVASPHELGLKHMMPSSEVFAKACSQLGISPSSHVVIYDSQGVFSSPRALFMFRAFGHEKSSIINGGLPKWIDEGLPLESESPSQPNPTEYPPPTFHSEVIRGYEDVVANSAFNPEENVHAELVFDARSKGRWLGTDPEPRQGLSSGHIPNSLSLPFNLFLQKHTAQDGSEYTTMLSPIEIRQVLEETVGSEEAEDIVSGQRSVVTSCGSGMTAGILWLGLQLLGARKVALYDESWTGYAIRRTSKIVKSTT